MPDGGDTVDGGGVGARLFPPAVGAARQRDEAAAVKPFTFFQTLAVKHHDSDPCRAIVTTETLGGLILVRVLRLLLIYSGCIWLNVVRAAPSLASMSLFVLALDSIWDPRWQNTVTGLRSVPWTLTLGSLSASSLVFRRNTQRPAEFCGACP